MRILVSNDDGINSEGILVLVKELEKMGHDVVVFSAAGNMSGFSHSIGVTSCLSVSSFDRTELSKWYVVNGTPTDCVIVGMKALGPERVPDLVISGINVGINVGNDITYSGTVGVCIEAALCNIPSIALSQSIIKGECIDWEMCSMRCHSILKHIFDAINLKKLNIECSASNVGLININFPSQCEAKGIKVVKMGRSCGLKYEDLLDLGHNKFVFSDRGNFAGSHDVQYIQDGYITITPLNIEMTCNKTMASLKNVFADFELDKCQLDANIVHKKKNTVQKEKDIFEDIWAC